ncbi:MAG: PHP domain-containing protein [Bacteroidales bacterium]|nr:PHP domain-containing protein [Bacteroidales bacterium]
MKNLRERKNFFSLLFIFLCVLFYAQPNIKLPNIEGYLTLKADFHMHTVFSDGLVWPTFRIEEAYREGIQVISMTEHVEYQPFSNFVKGDLNKSYEIAKKLAEKYGIILLLGAEITRSMPPGHSNAIFLNDANKLLTENYRDAYEEAKRQNAFIFWNHPCWKVQQPLNVKWWDQHTELYEAGLLHGIEIVNGNDYCEEAHRWCLEKNLTMIGNSDLHFPSCFVYSDKEHRPLTILFVKEATKEGCYEALQARRTLVLHKYNVYGFKNILENFIRACIQVIEINYQKKKHIEIIIQNHSSIPFQLFFPELSPKTYTISEGKNSISISAKNRTTQRIDSLDIIIKNAFPEPNVNLHLTYHINNP